MKAGFGLQAASWSSLLLWAKYNACMISVLFLSMKMNRKNESGRAQISLTHMVSAMNNLYFFITLLASKVRSFL